mmetsp:Transcript_34493/g.72618  ORF Transcript_34493/g.72618 Transcript_34493/m.72618 type:complete len:285 (-) Transcript_34493:488-1342(-)
MPMPFTGGSRRTECASTRYCSIRDANKKRASLIITALARIVTRILLHRLQIIPDDALRRVERGGHRVSNQGSVSREDAVAQVDVGGIHQGTRVVVDSPFVVRAIAAIPAATVAGGQPVLVQFPLLRCQFPVVTVATVVVVVITIPSPLPRPHDLHLPNDHVDRGTKHVAQPRAHHVRNDLLTLLQLGAHHRQVLLRRAAPIHSPPVRGARHEGEEEVVLLHDDLEGGREGFYGGVTYVDRFGGSGGREDGGEVSGEFFEEGPEAELDLGEGEGGEGGIDFGEGT